MSSHLTAARYGKDKVRVFRVVRDGDWHEVVEYNVCTLLEGDIADSYTKADNTVVVATDSIKNITYYLAKISPHILHPERFALHVGTHILAKYSHIHKAYVTIEQLRWRRIPVGGQDHKHSFYRDGDDKRTTRVEIDASAGADKMVAKITSGLADLLVIKTTGSAFENFIRDEYTTLAEVGDRIFSTSVDLQYTFSPLPIDPTKLGTLQYDKIAASARTITLEVFATDESASVQATLYKMAQKIIAEHANVESVTYALPNKHYIPVDMKYIGVDNLTPSNAEVFCPIAAPSGLISATISRK